MPIEIKTVPNEVLLEQGSARVYTADTISTASALSWTERPYVWVEELRMTAAPQIDQAILSSEYGDFITRERTMFNTDPFSGVDRPLDLDNKFVKIEIIAGVADPQNATVDADDILYTWYGRIESDEREHAIQNENVNEVTGRQRFTALGLLRLLERETIKTAWVEDAPDGNPMEIGRGIGFNMPDVGINEKYGNRSWQLATSGEGFIFSWYPSPEHDPDGLTETWDASAAITYLLERHNPADDSGDPLGNWSVNTDALDWYDISVKTDRRSVKDVLDDLVNRRRLAGYYVTAAEANDQLDVTVQVFTFTDAAINLTGGGQIPANDDLVILADTPSTRVRSLKLRRMTTQVYDTVRVEGRPVTSTASLHADESVGPLEEGWTATQQANYIELAGTSEENTIRRSSDEYRDVFSRFPLNQDWDHVVRKESDSSEYIVAMPVDLLPDTITDSEVATLFSVSGATPPNLWHMGKLLPQWLTLKDAETNEFRRPFVLFEDADDSTKFAYSEHLSAVEDRNFACHLQMLPETPGVRVIVAGSGGQQLIASSDWIAGTPGETPDHLDPENEVGAVDFLDMLFTATIEWDERIYVEVETSARTPSQGETLLIQLPDSRLDFELPGCVTDIDDSGQLVESTGLVLRDDRPRMREIAEAAAQWYGATRQTLVMEYVESFPFLEVGELITDVNVGTDSQAVLTPVTSVALNFAQGTATFATSYTEADFA